MSNLAIQYSPTTEQGRTILQKINSIPQNYTELAGMNSMVNRIRRLFLAEIKKLEGQGSTSVPLQNQDYEPNSDAASSQPPSVEQQIGELERTLNNLLGFCSDVSGVLRAKRFFSLGTENLGGDFNVSEQLNQLQVARLIWLKTNLGDLALMYSPLNHVAFLRGDHDITDLLLNDIREVTAQEANPLAAMPQGDVNRHICGTSESNLTKALYEIIQESHFKSELKAYIDKLRQSILTNFTYCYRQMSGFNKIETQPSDPATGGSSGIPSLASDHTTLLQRINYISQVLLNQMVEITSAPKSGNWWYAINIGFAPDLERALCGELFILDPNSEIAINQTAEDEVDWPKNITQYRPSLDVLIPDAQIMPCTAALIADEIESIKFRVAKACSEKSFSQDWFLGDRFRDMILIILDEHLQKNTTAWIQDIAENAQNLDKRSNPWNTEVGVPCGEIFGLVSKSLQEDKAVTGLFDLFIKNFALEEPEKFGPFGPWIIFKYYEANARDAVAMGESLNQDDREKFIENFFHDFSAEVCGWIKSTAKGSSSLEAVEQRITDLFKAEINSLRINAISESFNYSGPTSCTKFTDELTNELPELCTSLKNLMMAAVAFNLSYHTAYDFTENFINQEAVQTFLTSFN